MIDYKPTHKDLIVRAERWLRNTKRCSVVLTELVTAAGEIPDAVGWKSCQSIMIECKVSRSDFLRDAKKAGRADGLHVGRTHYYMAPAGLLTASDMPPYWGLLECTPKSVRVVKRAAYRPCKDEKALTTRLISQQREIIMLVSALRRASE